MNEKPITLVIEDTKKEIAEVINKSGLPPFIIESIIKDMHVEISNIARQQYENDLKSYNESKKEEDNK